MTLYKRFRGQEPTIDALLIRNGIKTVSYTHLDVYKRQVYVYGIFLYGKLDTDAAETSFQFGVHFFQLLCRDIGLSLIHI